MRYKRNLALILAIVLSITMIPFPAGAQGYGMQEDFFSLPKFTGESATPDETEEDSDETEEDSDETEESVPVIPSTPGTTPSDPNVTGEAPELTGIDIEYSLDRKLLVIEWEGKNIDSVKIYLDGDLLDTKQGDRLVCEMDFAPLTKHTFRLIPYNNRQEEGKEKIYELAVEDYVAKIENLQAKYLEAEKKITMSWQDVNTKYVNISLNEETLVENCTAKNYEIFCELQPGAKYVITVSPYNYKNVLGEEEEDDVSIGYFEIPGDFSARQISIPIKDGYGHYTGFSKPSMQLQWEAQNRAVYEIYRAEKDKMSAYQWIATVKSNLEGTYTYTDEKAGFSLYYYKIRRKIVEDDYIEQELCTALSEAEEVNANVSKPTLAAQLNEDGKIALSLNAKKEYVSGYDIYRKKGREGYRFLATVNGDEYIDEAIEFGQTYHYKAKAYYYDMESKKRSTGVYSNQVTVKNTIGNLYAQVAAVSATTVMLTWNAPANAKEYEIYYKSGMRGDSYALLATTTEKSLTKKLKNSGTYYFMVKACQTTGGGKSYFSSAEVSIKMGFAPPANVHIQRTVYRKNAQMNAYMQEDTIAWNGVYGASGYYVERYNAASGEYEQIAAIKNNRKTTYTVSNQVTEDASAQKYRISAYKKSRVQTGGTVTVEPKLGAPTRVTAAEAAGSKIKISWKSVAWADRYKVYRSNGRTMILIGETARTSVFDQGLSAGVPYKYYVCPVDSAKNLIGLKSEPAVITISQSKVKGFSAVSESSGSIQLSWNKNKMAQGYIIYYSKSENGPYEKLAELTDKKKIYIHKGLQPGMAYFYKIVAYQTNCAGALAESQGTFASASIRQPQ